MSQGCSEVLGTLRDSTTGSRRPHWFEPRCHFSKGFSRLSRRFVEKSQTGAGRREEFLHLFVSTVPSYPTPSPTGQDPTLTPPFQTTETLPRTDPEQLKGRSKRHVHSQDSTRPGPAGDRRTSRQTRLASTGCAPVCRQGCLWTTLNGLFREGRSKKWTEGLSGPVRSLPLWRSGWEVRRGVHRGKVFLLLLPRRFRTTPRVLSVSGTRPFTGPD